jgi:hypothetical protein
LDEIWLFVIPPIISSAIRLELDIDWFWYFSRREGRKTFDRYRFSTNKRIINKRIL